MTDRTEVARLKERIDVLFRFGGDLPDVAERIELLYREIDVVRGKKRPRRPRMDSVDRYVKETEGDRP
jgi:hypothetical protein